MKSSAVKWLAGMVAGLCLCTISVGTTQAGIIPWMYNAVFGPAYNGPGRAAYYGGACYGPVGYGSPYAMGGCSTGGCGVSSYYGPVTYGGCGTSCAPSCGPCSIGCGSVASLGCAPCGTGDCSVPPAASGSSAPGGAGTGVAPYDRSQGGASGPTYRGPNPAPGGSSSQDAIIETPRTSPSSGFRRVTPPADGGSATDQDSFRLPTTTDESKPGATSPTQPVNPKPARPSAPAIREEGKNIQPIKPLNLDEKVASRPAPERKRLTVTAKLGEAELVRNPVYPATDWIPVSSAAKLASK